MSTCAIIENNTLFNLRENEYINTLIRENDTLKFNNNKLYPVLQITMTRRLNR